MQPDDHSASRDGQSGFPIESDVEGVVQTWLVEEGDEATVGESLVQLEQVVQSEPDTQIHSVIQRGKRHLLPGLLIFDETMEASSGNY